MKKIYFYLIVATLSLAAACNSGDKSNEETEQVQAQAKENLKEYVNNLDSVTLNKIKTIDKKTTISTADLAPGDKNVTMRQKKYYQTETGENLAVAYAFYADGKSFIMLEKEGGKPITMQLAKQLPNGGEYKTETTIWSVDGNHATLTENNATKQYKELDPSVQ